jgi:hypothetical protein
LVGIKQNNLHNVEFWIELQHFGVYLGNTC